MVFKEIPLRMDWGVIQLSPPRGKHFIDERRLQLPNGALHCIAQVIQETSHMRLATLLISTAVLAGCNVHKTDDADGNVTIQANTDGEVNFNVPFVQGKIKLPEGAMQNSNFDIDGVKLMPGSTVTGVSVFAGDKGSTVHMAFKAPAAPDAVRAYFAGEFAKQGVEATVSGDSVAGKSKDGTPFTIKVGPGANGSEGTIDIQDKD
jgi:hypothetical protein